MPTIARSISLMQDHGPLEKVMPGGGQYPLPGSMGGTYPYRASHPQEGRDDG